MTFTSFLLDSRVRAIAGKPKTQQRVRPKSEVFCMRIIPMLIEMRVY